MAGMNGTDSMLRMEQARTVQSNSQQSPWISAQVKRTNVPAQKITVSHAAIKSIGMPAMMMTFTVADQARLATLKRGDRVDIQAADLASAATVVNFRQRY
jgi:Cu/Ag efflux protein CusF